LRVELYVCAVGIEKVELHPSRVGPTQFMLAINCSHHGPDRPPASARQSFGGPDGAAGAGRGGGDGAAFALGRERAPGARAAARRNCETDTFLSMSRLPSPQVCLNDSIVGKARRLGNF
jgi:hypothetical protein